MKPIKSITLITLALLFAGNIFGQTADEIIAKYIDAIGGKDKLTKITSVRAEGTLSVMGSEGTLKLTTLNGKGMRQDVDIMGSTITTCFNDKEGWSVNPLAGSYSAEAMPETLYKAGKDQIIVGGPFINLAETGNKAELIGKDSVGTNQVYKIKVTMPDGGIPAVYLFDVKTNLLVQATTETDMQGQLVDNVMTYSDYKSVDGYLMAYKMDMSLAGGQVTMNINLTKVELNVPVDTTLFAKPL